MDPKIAGFVGFVLVPIVLANCRRTRPPLGAYLRAFSSEIVTRVRRYLRMLIAATTLHLRDSAATFLLASCIMNPRDFFRPDSWSRPYFQRPFAGGYAKMRTELELTNATEWLDSSEDEPSEYYIFILPCIVLFGLCGNVISLVTILHSRLRQISANHYLLILTAADSVFLVGLTLVLFKVDFVAYEFCVIIEYILMTSSYVSSWSIAALTIERYIAIAHPLRHVRWADVDRLRIILYWIPIPFILNLIQFISLIPYDDKTDPNYPHIRKCVPYNGRLQCLASAASNAFDRGKTIKCHLTATTVLRRCRRADSHLCVGTGTMTRRSEARAYDLGKQWGALPDADVMWGHDWTAELAGVNMDVLEVFGFGRTVQTETRTTSALGLSHCNGPAIW
uniref:G_PROTEIN_RECEP_F1_2 domain-containing protein n=1 Tax=Steinernema glaseri TaxID=37863 RepID=A0A1I7Y5I8_9BILA